MPLCKGIKWLRSQQIDGNASINVLGEKSRYQMTDWLGIPVLNERIQEMFAKALATRVFNSRSIAPGPTNTEPFNVLLT